MRTTSTLLVAASTFTALVLAPPATARADAEVEIDAPLVPTADGLLAASGMIELKIDKNEIELEIELEDLPLGVYDVVIGSVKRGEIIVDPSSIGDDDDDDSGSPSGKLELSTDPGGDCSKKILEFEPFGLPVAIEQAGVALLAGMVPDIDLDNLPTAMGDDFPSQKVQVDMTNTGVAPEAEAQIKFKSKRLQADLEIAVKDLPAGTYDLVVNDVVITSAFYDGTGKEKLRLSTRPRGDRLPLDFDPAGAIIKIAQGATDFFTLTLSADPLPGMFPPGELEVDFASTGVQPNAEGDAEFRQRPGRQDFKVEIEDVEAGVYDLHVDGVSVAMILAAPTADGVEGEVEFRSLPNDDPDKLDLTFDPRGKVIQVLKDGVVILAATLPAS